jgi:RNA polymerase sigma-70 factor (ECF subfamily)
VPYVFSAVRNAAIDQTRRAAARRRLESASIFNGLAPPPTSLAAGEGTADPQAAAITAEQHERLRRAVDTLPQADRETVVMRIYGDLTFEQMAEALSEPLPTVASRYRRALERLEGYFNDDHGLRASRGTQDATQD